MLYWRIKNRKTILDLSEPLFIEQAILTDAQPQTLPVTIPIAPWLLDHRFEGAAILPAVEMLQHMARVVQSHSPSAVITSLQCASFDRFLQIEPAATSINAACTLTIKENGEIQALLSTTAQIGNAGVTRIKEHATVCFSQTVPLVSAMPEGVHSALNIPGFEIPAQRLYAELVPFGPAFQSVQKKVILTESAAVACVHALDQPEANGPLGSSFPFDGSLHAACAWAQRYCGIIAFPVGFAGRLLVQPISPGETIHCVAIPKSVSGGIIKFDLWLFDDSSRLREMVAGIEMRDVSAGRLKPPAWVRSQPIVRLA